MNLIKSCIATIFLLSSCQEGNEVIKTDKKKERALNHEYVKYRYVLDNGSGFWINAYMNNKTLSFGDFLDTNTISLNKKSMESLKTKITFLDFNSLPDSSSLNSSGGGALNTLEIQLHDRKVLSRVCGYKRSKGHVTMLNELLDIIERDSIELYTYHPIRAMIKYRENK